MTCGRNSTTPTSHALMPFRSPSNGRAKPRPSSGGQPLLLPLSIATLPGLRSIVGTNPPFVAGACNPNVLPGANCDVTALPATNAKQVMSVVKIASPESALKLCGEQLGPAAGAASKSTVEDLRALGAVPAYARVKAHTPGASLNLLWALEGALSGLPWQTVAREHRASLLLALETCQRPPASAC